MKMLKEFSLPFWFQTRFEDITKPTLEALKEAGCYRISFGLEHGNLNSATATTGFPFGFNQDNS
jgi:hypothetical protein